MFPLNFLNHAPCTDINECEGESPCDGDTETCSNLIGSFKCKCNPGLIRVDEKCVEKVVKEPKKPKKKKKKTKKGESEEEPVRPDFPWYHILAPLTLAIITYKYSQPTLVTSVVMTLPLIIAALHR